MIDFYEKVDFDQEVWVFYDILTIQREVLRHVCRNHGDPDSKYWVEGCKLFEYQANRQLPRSVVATFDTEAEAEHAYWLLLKYHTEFDDDMPVLRLSASDAAEFCGEIIRDWDSEYVEDLRYWLRTLDKVCEVGGLDRQGYVDMSDLGGVPLPDDIDASYPVWAMDVDGNMLVGGDAESIEHVDEHRANREAA